MSEAFFSKFTELLFGLFMLIILFLADIMVILVYFNTQNIIFYYVYLGILFFSFAYALNYSRQFRNFKENLHLFIPSENSKPIEPLNMEIDDLPLKCALYYRNGASFDKIARSLSLPESESAKRKVIEGIDFLLKFYKENNCKKVEPC